MWVFVFFVSVARFCFVFDLIHLFARIVSLDRFGDDGAGRIAFLEVLTLGCNRPRHVTTRQPESNRQARQYRRHDRCYDFVNFVFVHN